MVKPASFGVNVETAASNAFQRKIESDKRLISKKALLEFENMLELLQSKGIDVLLIEDNKSPIKPDAVFPNNWISMHSDGTVILYPMLAENRRTERRDEILVSIQKDFEINKILDLTIYEKEQVFLEGTGSIVFDHLNQIAYACLSPRTNKKLFEETCLQLGYRAISFTALDNSGIEIYHTNVMMNIGNGYALICLDSIKNRKEQNVILQTMEKAAQQLIPITLEQMHSFCGNMLELEVNNGKNLLILSQTAANALTESQIFELAKHCELLPISIPTIEQIGGGSVRCMIAEIFLPKRFEKNSFS